MFDFEAEVDRSISLLQKKAQSVPVRSGTVVRLVGLRMEARGLMAPIGACCAVEGTSGHRIEAEVVGFSDKTLYLMPFLNRWASAPVHRCACSAKAGMPIWAKLCWAG